jgi:LysM repeat protein
MPSVGKPLAVTESTGVARINPVQAVLAPNVQPLSSNVAAQKIQFADYNIGQSNVKASYAVSDELINMVDAGIKAKMYIDNTKQDYQRLNLMEEWQQSDMDYKMQFAKATTPETQEAVIADYGASLDQRTGAWRKSMRGDLESEKYLSSLRAGSQKQFSAFSTTHSQSLHKRTASLHTLNIERVAKSLAEDKNADVVSGFKSIQDSTASLVGMGAIESEVAQFNFDKLKDTIITGRSGLFAQDFAKNAIETGHYPTDKEFKTQMEGVMGIELGERRLKLLKESFTDSYFKEIGERNRQVKAEETYALQVTETGRLALKDEVNKALQDKTIAPELKEKLIKKAKTFDYAMKGFSAMIEKQIRESEYGTSYKPFVDHFTTGEGRNFILENIKADGTSYFNLNELRSHLETMGGKYEGMNESTIREVLTHWRGINDSTRKGLADQGEEVMQTALMSMIKKDQTQVPEWLQDATIKRLGVTGPMLNNMRDPMHLNWSKTMRYSPAHAKAWNVTLSDIKAQFDSKQGVFSKENISQPADVQRSMLENYVGKLLEKNFSESVNEELARLDNEKLQKREKIETEERRKQAQVNKELPKFAMEKLGDGVSPTEPTPKEVSPYRQLIEHQMSKKRIRNAQYASTFKDQLSKGELGSAVGTAVASQWTDITQAIRDAHEQTNLLYETDTTRHRLNDRKRHLKDMAVMSKNVKETFAGGIWDTLAQAVGQKEPITLEGLSNDMGLLTSVIGDLLIDGVENHSIEKTPITDTKRTKIKTPDPLATPPATQPTEPPNVVQDVVENPIIKNIVGTINDLMGGVATTAEAATTGQRVVQAGDTLSAIAREAGISPDALQALNPNISDPNMIQAGQSINVPQGTAPTTASTNNVSEIPVHEQPLVESVGLREATEQQAISAVQDNGNAGGYGHTFQGNEKAEWLAHPINTNNKSTNAANKAWRKQQANAWLEDDVVKSSGFADQMVQEWEAFNGTPPPPLLHGILTRMNFQLGEGWRSKFPSAWKGMLAGSNSGTTPMFKDKTGWEQAIYHLQHKNERSKALSNWNTDTPVRVQDAVLGIEAIAGKPESPVLKPSLVSEVLPTAPKLYAKAMSGDRGIWKEDVFSGEEQSQLKDIVAEKIKQGNFLISYSDYDEEAGSKIGYGMEVPDSGQGLKFSLGQARIVRNGNKIMVVDEWDIDSPEKINEMPVMDRMATLFEKVKSGDTSMYGFAHLLGEAFGPQSGEGASIRATIGTAKSLKLSKAQLAKIPQLKQYEADNKHRINPENLGKFA